MDENTRKLLRREGNTQGGVLLIYMGIMNASVILLIVASVIMQMLNLLLSGAMTDLNGDIFIIDSVAEKATEAGYWGYLLSIAICFVILLLWKKPAYIKQTICASGRTMKATDFLLITAIFLMGQQLFQWWYLFLESLSNWLGISLRAVLESGSVETDTVPMFLYVCLFGPIAEEILFRGVMIRSLQPYGKKFAILVSALLFGLFHGNLMQAPFAFAVGLVLGYVALEYNIYWAIVLHLINNFLLADLVPRALSLLPEKMGDLVFTVFLLACTLAAVIILILRWRDVRAYWQENPTEKGSYKAFFRAPAMVVFLIITVPIMIIALPLLASLSQ